MKTPEQIIAVIGTRIGHIYDRPFMYTGTGNGVECVILICHSLWAEIVDRQAEFSALWENARNDEDCGPVGFSTAYKLSHTEASEQEIAAYVVAKWGAISNKLGVSVGQVPRT